jgi:hypothetical protein
MYTRLTKPNISRYSTKNPFSASLQQLNQYSTFFGSHIQTQIRLLQWPIQDC